MFPSPALLSSEEQRPHALPWDILAPCGLLHKDERHQQPCFRAETLTPQAHFQEVRGELPREHEPRFESRKLQ